MMLLHIIFVVATGTENSWNNTVKNQKTRQKKESSVVQEAHLLFYSSH